MIHLGNRSSLGLTSRAGAPAYPSTHSLKFNPDGNAGARSRRPDSVARGKAQTKPLGASGVFPGLWQWLGRAGRLPLTGSKLVSAGLWMLVLGGWLLGSVRVQGQAVPVDTQTVSLRKGWNAVALRVEPHNRDPQAVFAGSPVDKVATYFPTRSPVEFIQDPAAIPFKQKGWSVWFAPSLPEAALSELSAILGGQCYLVHATGPTTLNIAGRVVFRRASWKPDSFNFTGFPIDPVNPPTFKTWFSGSTAHQSTQRAVIYTLNANDQWIAVDRPESTLIKANEAYWVFCQGASDHQGPLDVAVPFGVRGSQADFGDVKGKMLLRFRNNTAFPAHITVDLAGNSGLSLFYEKQALSQGATLTLPFASPVLLDTLEAGLSADFYLALDRAELPAGGGAAILTVRDDVGTLVRIPVTAKLP